MKSKLRLAPAFLVLGLIFTQLLTLEAATITVTVAYKDEEQQYSVPEFLGHAVWFPIQPASTRLIFRADWGGSEDGVKTLLVSLQDPAVLLPGLASESYSTPPVPLTVFSASYPFVTGKRILVYKEPIYSLWLQFDEDKKER